MMCKTQTERALLQRAEWAERRLMEIEHERLLEQDERRRQADHDRQALAEAERRKADEEREQVRRGAWWDYLMDKSQPERFKKHVIDNQFDVTKIKTQIPDDPAVYPPNFDPSEVEYAHDFPGDGVRTPALVPSDEPTLVQQGRRLGAMV